MLDHVFTDAIGAVRRANGRLSLSCLPAFLTTALASRYLMLFKMSDYAPSGLSTAIAVPRLLMALYVAALWYRLRNRGGGA